MPTDRWSPSAFAISPWAPDPQYPPVRNPKMQGPGRLCVERDRYIKRNKTLQPSFRYGDRATVSHVLRRDESDPKETHRHPIPKPQFSPIKTDKSYRLRRGAARLRKCRDVGFARTQEIEEVDTSILAAL